jgi:hypothetical protein
MDLVPVIAGAIWDVISFNDFELERLILGAFGIHV